MKAQKEFIVIGVRDAQDNTWIGIADHPRDRVIIYFMSGDTHGATINCPVYEIPERLEHGWQCTITKRTIEVEFPERTIG